MTTTNFKTIALKDIRPDENQPRKIYDETAMQELVASVKEKGILQPILIRPNGKGYILVCGERRYRASKEAGLGEIPAVIRELSDEEALELQIIENLQRKDVHPMEEAVAFKSLRDKFSVEDIAIKVGKSPVFVAQRIKLTDLIEDFQEMLYQNKLSLKDAISLCRQSVDVQKVVLKEVTNYAKEWRKKADFHAQYIDRYLDNQSQTLDRAPFKTNDAALYPEMGACSTCSFNSANSPLLFPELGKKRLCSNTVCFQVKVQRSYQNKIKEIVSDPEILFVSTSYYLGDEEKKKIKAVEELGVKVLENDLVEVVEAPEPVQSWEEFQKEWHVDDEDDLNDCKERYEEEVAEYNEELARYNQNLASGNIRKAFVVAGNSNEGKIVNIVIKAKKGSKADVSVPGNAELVLLEQEISEIKQRESRNKELDNEKVFKRLVELFKLDGNAFLLNEDGLSPDEWAAVLYAISESSYSVREYLEETLKVEHSYNENKLYKAIYKNQDNTILHKAFRLFIHDKLINLNECDYEKRGKAAAMYEVGKQYFKKDLTTFELEQKEKAAKRQGNVNKRLEALEAKKLELQPAPAAKPESPKVKKAKA